MAWTKNKGSDVDGEEQKDHLLFCQKWLREKGLDQEWEPRVCQPDQLFIDLDTPEAHNQFHDQWALFTQHWPAATVTWSISKSGNQHVIVDLHEKVSDAWRVAAQACLGSDPKRELLHLVSLMKHELNSIILFERIQDPLVDGTVADAVPKIDVHDGDIAL